MMRPKHAFPSVFADLCDARIVASFLRFILSHHSFGAAGVTERYGSLDRKSVV